MRLAASWIASCSAGPALALAAGLAGCGSTAPDAAPRLVNRLGMEMVLVPAGRFRMGLDRGVDALAADFPALPRERLQLLDDERPAHEVTISRPFWLGRHEVTVGQFRAFLQASGHVPESVADGTGAYGFDAERARRPPARGDAFAGRDPRWSWANPGFEQGDDHPVVNVTWNDAVAMAEWLTRMEAHAGRRYRLPTEAEWEYACRAGTRGHWHGGDDPAALAGAANLFDADALDDWTGHPSWVPHAVPGRDGWRFTAPVGRFAPNGFGLHDLHGNVWEWVADRYSDDAYARGRAVDPQGPAEGHLRVRRGGSWHTWPVYARCGYRNWNTASTRYVLVGFRLAADAADAAPAPSR